MAEAATRRRGRGGGGGVRVELPVARGHLEEPPAGLEDEAGELVHVLLEDAAAVDPRLVAAVFVDELDPQAGLEEEERSDLIGR